MSQSSARRSGGRQVKKKSNNNRTLLIAGAVVVLIIAGVALYNFTRGTTSAAVGQQIPDLGSNQHLLTPDQALPVAWNSNPPTSGYHWGGGVAPWGVQTQPLSDTITVHNLEHGGVIIHYREGLDQPTVDQLTTLARELQRQNPCLIMEPRPANKIDAPIIMTAWTYMLKLDTFNADEIRSFFRAHVGRAPEQICPVGVGG